MWVEVITAISGSGITAGGVLAVATKWLKKAVHDIATDTVEPVAVKLSNLELSLATQFGGNGGGMRQAINELREDVAELKGTVHVLVREV